MFNTLLNFLQSGLPTDLLSVFFIYIIALWLVLCVWVFVDARKRYRKIPVAILFFFVVFILNFPGLIFYLIVRPEIEDTYNFGGDTTSGGVNIPLANFLNNNGEIMMSFNLKVSPQINNPTDMNIDINWEGDKVEQPKVKTTELEVKEPEITKTIPLNRKFQLPKFSFRKPALASVNLEPVKQAVVASKKKLKSKKSPNNSISAEISTENKSAKA